MRELVVDAERAVVDFFAVGLPAVVGLLELALRVEPFDEAGLRLPAAEVDFFVVVVDVLAVLFGVDFAELALAAVDLRAVLEVAVAFLVAALAAGFRAVELLPVVFAVDFLAVDFAVDFFAVDLPAVDLAAGLLAGLLDAVAGFADAGFFVVEALGRDVALVAAVDFFVSGFFAAGFFAVAFFEAAFFAVVLVVIFDFVAVDLVASGLLAGLPALLAACFVAFFATGLRSAGFELVDFAADFGAAFFAAGFFASDFLGWAFAAGFFVSAFFAAGFVSAFFAAGFVADLAEAAGFFVGAGVAAAFSFGGATCERTTGVPSFVTVLGAVVARGEPSEVLPLTGSCFALASGRLVMWSSSSSGVDSGDVGPSGGTHVTRLPARAAEVSNSCILLSVGGVSRRR